MKDQWVKWKLVFGLLIWIGFLNGCSSPSDPLQEDGKAINDQKPATHTVEIKQMKFIPGTLTVNKEDTVIFINRDILTHDVTEELSRSWSSSPLKANETWVLTATESVNYFCSIHPVMKGNIVVK